MVSAELMVTKTGRAKAMRMDIKLTNAVHVQIPVRKEEEAEHKTMETQYMGILRQPIEAVPSCFEHDDKYE